MKKNKRNGFMLIETLLVSTFVLAVLTYIFLHFSALKRSYDDSFKYNTVPALYGAKNINQIIVASSAYDTLKNQVQANNLGYIQFECAIVSNTSTCINLLNDLNVEKVYFVNDLTFKDNVNTNMVIFSNDNELYHFAKKIGYSENNEDYRLIVKYNDNTFATIAITL